MCKYFQLLPSFSLLSFFSPFMLLNVHRRYRGGGWGGVKYLCPLPVNVKNLMTACRSLLSYVLCQCQELHDYMQITIFPVSFVSNCQEPHDCMQITIYPMSFASQCQELHDCTQITIYPMSFASQCQECHDCMQITIYPMSFANVKNFTTAYRSPFIMCPFVASQCQELYFQY